MAKTLWGGRFKSQMNSTFQCFSYSLYVDFQLLEAELEVDRAWAKMLGRTKLITRQESVKLVKALHAVAKKLRLQDPHDKLPKTFLNQYEDIHTLIEAELEKKAGNLAKKIHTGRSRNDLVVTSTRLYLKKKIEAVASKVTELEKSLVILAKRSGDSVVSGMTHLKKAQPILFAHHLLAYVEMLEEDKARILDSAKRADVLPLGSAALAGSSLGIDQKFLARELGFSKIAANSMAATSDRSFIVEFVGALAILWMHLSRMAEDFILWNSEAFNYIELDDAFATGSSLMPQKKNPDVFELVRGRSGVIFGHLQSLLTIQKGLPLAYNRDLQEDKPALFDSANKTQLALEVLALAIRSISLNRKAMQASIQDDNLFATDILEYLVRKKVPFRQAHETVGRAVRFALESGRPLREIALAEWKRFSPAFDGGVYDLFDARSSVRAKKTIGSTNPAMAAQQIKKWEKQLRTSF
ncbi:MAG: argininosuccinate lyase [Candidatus Omnitrophica bacterium]|nr:argininosuccinate lyase [Candidatus Omnitrophota bacterium]